MGLLWGIKWVSNVKHFGRQCLAHSNCSVWAIIIVISFTTASSAVATNRYLVAYGETGQLLLHLWEIKSRENLHYGLLTRKRGATSPRIRLLIHWEIQYLFQLSWSTHIPNDQSPIKVNFHLCSRISLICSSPSFSSSLAPFLCLRGSVFLASFPILSLVLSSGTWYHTWASQGVTLHSLFYNSSLIGI